MKALGMLLLISIYPIALHGTLEFNNLRCLPLDKEFVHFDYCFLKSVNRTYKYASLKTKIHYLPIDNCVIQIEVKKRETRRILYNFDVRVDGCKFLKERNNVIANWVFQTFAPFSNINHTCPYHHDIIVDKMPVQHVNRIIHSVIPEGRYYVNLTWITDKIPRAETSLYFTKS